MTNAQTKTIFVQIAAYRDAECEPTLRDLFEKAAQPENIIVGLCWQHIPGVDDDLLPLEIRKDQIRLLKIDAKDSHGACWARHQVQQLWQGEDYFLQIDSHMRFEPEWDTKLIAQLALCPSEKAVLTGYPPAYTPPRNLHKNERHIMMADAFNAEGMMTFRATPAGENNSVPTPVYGMFCSAGFMFGPGSAIREVPYDPHLYFYGEESTMSVRLWTHGYDIYHPNENVLYHYYRQTGDVTHRTHWGDNTEWYLINQRALARVQHLLTGAPTDHPEALREVEKYGLGSVRSLAEYEAISGINFKQATITEDARNGVFNRP